MPETIRDIAVRISELKEFAQKWEDAVKIIQDVLTFRNVTDVELNFVLSLINLYLKEIHISGAAVGFEKSKMDKDLLIVEVAEVQSS